MGFSDWLLRLFGRPTPTTGSVDQPAWPGPAEPPRRSGELEDSPAPPDSVVPVWCVAANVVVERSYGPGGTEVRRGTKHFAPGAKVYVFHFYWGMGGERVTVVGRHRRSKRYITLIMPAAHLANWRAELVYSLHVVRQVLEYGDFAGLPPGGDESRLKAERIAASYRQNGGNSQPFTTRPPLDGGCPGSERLS